MADRLIERGWSETRARKGVVTVAFLTGLLLIPAARVDAPGAAVALIVGGCLVGLATGNLLVDSAELRAAGRDRPVDRRLQLHRQHRRHSVAAHHGLPDREDRIVHAARSCWPRALIAVGPLGALDHRQGIEGKSKR